MMKFKSLIVAAALSIGGIGGISANAAAGTVMVSTEGQAAAVQVATFRFGESAGLATAEQSQDASVPFTHPAAFPGPASWSMILLGFASLGLFGFTGKNRSRRDTIPSFATAKI